MNALATFDDVQAEYPGEIPAADEPRLTRLLENASAVVRNYTRQAFTRQSSTARLRPIGYKVRLPQRPVVSVESVAIVDGTNLLPFTGWVWDGGSEVWIGGGSTVVNLPEAVGDLFRYTTPLVEVSYTHGYDEVPVDVKAVVVGLVARTYAAPGVAGVFKSQTVGPFSGTLTDSATQGITSLGQAEREILNAYRRSSTSVELR